MPNHCEQDMYVTGDVESLKAFLEFAKEDDHILSANKFIPYPEKYKEMDRIAEEYGKAHPDDWRNRPKDGFNSGGYEWCCQNWGTKWGIYDCTITSQKLTGKKGKLSFTFQYAWSPALRVIDAMSEKFPTLHFKVKYFEGGMGYQGTYVVQGGNVLEDTESKYGGHRGG